MYLLCARALYAHHLAHLVTSLLGAETTLWPCYRHVKTCTHIYMKSVWSSQQGLALKR